VKELYDFVVDDSNEVEENENENEEPS